MRRCCPRCLAGACCQPQQIPRQTCLKPTAAAKALPIRFCGDWVSTTASTVRLHCSTQSYQSPCHGLNCASDAARLSRPHATRLERTRRETSRLRRGSRGVNAVPAALWGDWVGATVPLLPQAGRPSSTGSAPPRLTELTDRAPSRDERGDRLSCRANAWPCKARRGTQVAA